MPQMRAVMSGASLIHAAAQEGFEEPRRLENVELRRLHDAVARDDLERALALDAGELSRP